MKQKMAKILLVLLLGAVFLPAGAIWAYPINFTGTNGLDVNLWVDWQTNETTGLTKYFYQIEVIGGTINTFILSGILGVQAGSTWTMPNAGWDTPVPGLETPPTSVSVPLSGTVTLPDQSTIPYWSVLWTFSGLTGFSPEMWIESSVRPNESGDPLLILNPSYSNFKQTVTVQGPGVFAETTLGTREPVPEPATLLLLGSGLILGGFKLRRKKA